MYWQVAPAQDVRPCRWTGPEIRAVVVFGRRRGRTAYQGRRDGGVLRGGTGRDLGDRLGGVARSDGDRDDDRRVPVAAVAVAGDLDQLKTGPTRWKSRFGTYTTSGPRADHVAVGGAGDHLPGEEVAVDVDAQDAGEGRRVLA